MWGLAVVVYSVCVSGAAQDQRCLGECQSITLDLFYFQLRVLSSS